MSKTVGAREIILDRYRQILTDTSRSRQIQTDLHRSSLTDTTYKPTCEFVKLNQYHIQTKQNQIRELKPNQYHMQTNMRNC